MNEYERRCPRKTQLLLLNMRCMHSKISSLIYLYLRSHNRIEFPMKNRSLANKSADHMEEHENADEASTTCGTRMPVRIFKFLGHIP